MNGCNNPGFKGLKLCRREKGSTLLEFAVTLTFFLLMMFGVLDFGRALYAYHFVSSAARQATRWAAVNGETCADDGSCNGTAPMNNGPASASDIQSYVTNITPPGIDPTKVTTTPTWTAPTGSPNICTSAVTGLGGPFENYPGCTVEVEVQYKFNFVAPIISKATVTMSSTSEMVIAH
jgi:Flp pilus assembly protein TadG